jgi:hypothetical protein
LAKPAGSGQNYRLASAQGFAAAGLATISGKLEIFWALFRDEVEIAGVGADFYGKIGGNASEARRDAAMQSARKAVRNFEILRAE